MTKTLTAAVLMIAALVLSGCHSGGSGDNSNSNGPSAAQRRHDSTASKSISRGLLSSSKKSPGITSALDFSKKNTECIGNGLVDKIGTKRLQQYGLLDKNYHVQKSVTGLKLKAPDAKKATDVFFSCIDISKAFHAVIAKSAATLPPKAKSCINQIFTNAKLKPVFEKYFEGDPQGAQSLLQGPLSRCAAGSAG
jgi:hypothetical protein